MPRRYPPEFRRKVLDLLKAGESRARRCRPRSDGADDLRVAQPGADRHWATVGRVEQQSWEHLAARKRIADLDTEKLAVTDRERAVEGGGQPKRRWAAIAMIASDGRPIQVACRVLDVTKSGYFAWRKRAPSARVSPPRLAHGRDRSDPHQLPHGSLRQAHIRTLTSATRSRSATTQSRC